MQQPLQPLTTEELQHLAELREVCQTTDSPGWMRVVEQMQASVLEAHEAMIGNTSHDPMSYMHLQLRWQQREAMLRGVQQYVHDCNEQKHSLLEQIKLERSSGEEENAERYQEA